MAFTILAHEDFLKDLKKLDHSVKMELDKKLDVLKENPFRGKPLKGGSFYSERLGGYRFIYKIDGETIHLLAIQKRKSVYAHFTPK